MELYSAHHFITTFFHRQYIIRKKMPPSPVSIIGAGFSGLVLGQCLRRRNIPAVIYERTNSDLRNNYGITLYNSTYRPLLESLGINEDEFKRQVAIHHPENSELISDGRRLRVNRAALTRILRKDLDIRWEHKLSDISASTSSKSAVFTVGDQKETQDYGLLIAADGAHSATRSLLNLPTSTFDLKVLPFIVFNGKRRIAYSSLPSGLLDSFTNPDGITHTQGDALLTIKADFWDAEKQVVAVSYTLSRVAGEKDQPLLDRNIRDSEKLAKHFIEEVSALGETPGPFRQVFNPDTMPEDRLLHWLMRSALLESKGAEDIFANKGVLLLGDAAHTQQPLSGNGASLAIADAIELAKHINSSGEVDDVAAYLNDRAQAWVEGTREAEQSLQNSHASSNDKARM
jgi:2-polyprenyl-6-methoxyphenol hydroxylase-like FAD-dependent oxidoreductase